MNSNQIPSLNPSNNGTLIGTFRQVMSSMMLNVNGLLPAQVIAYEPSNTGDRVQVQPLIPMVDTAGNAIQRAQVASIPVIQIGGGGFIIRIPLNVGDLGWIMANDRDISLFLQNYQVSPPNTYRTFSFSDGIFLPAQMTGYTIADEDLTNAVIQNLDGTVKISLNSVDSTLTLTAPIVQVNGALSVSGAIDANGINISGGITPNVIGDLFVDGYIQATGPITPDVPP